MSLPQVCNTPPSPFPAPCAPGALLYYLWAGVECRCPPQTFPGFHLRPGSFRTPAQKPWPGTHGSFPASAPAPVSSTALAQGLQPLLGFTVQKDGTSQLPGQMTFLENFCTASAFMCHRLSPEEVGNTIKMGKKIQHRVSHCV